MPADLHRYLSEECLTPLWSAARRRLEGNRLSVRGAVTVTLDDVGADRLGGLLGTVICAGQVRVRLEAVDEALRRSSARCGLLSALEQFGAGPVVDRSAAREHVREQRTALWSDLDAALAASGFADASWVPNFTDSLRRSGILTRAGSSAASAIRQAGAVLTELGPSLRAACATPAQLTDPTWELAQLASVRTGSAHGLDDGTIAAALVLRAGAAALAEAVPESAAQRRQLWERLGVSSDLVSGTVLTWALRPPGNRPWASMMRDRADLNLVTHLSVHELRAAGGEQDLVEADVVVFACENPQVLQSAARANVNQPLLCLSGNPASAGWLVVRRLLAAGVSVRYHGDFDWPGVAIAARLFESGATPWRFDAHSYRTAVERHSGTATLALSGNPVPTPWDRDLSAAMGRIGAAVHEESVLADLLLDLAGGAET